MSPFLVHQLLVAAAERTPDALALVDPKRRLSYRELEEESARASACLAAAGVGPGDLVAISMEKNATAVAAVYGILRRGAAYVPIDPAMPDARVERILARTEIEVVVTTSDRVARLAASKPALPSLRHLVLTSGAPASGELGALAWSDLGSAQLDRAALVDVTENHLAYVLHTSGSTGQPKGVAITHRNCLAFVEPATARFAITAADRLACQAPLHFDLSVFDLYCAARAGAAVVLLPEHYSAFPKKMSQAIAEHRVTVWNSVVSALSLLADKGKLAEFERESLRAVIFSGEKMPIPLLRRLSALLPAATFFNVYGQTEANSSLVHELREVPTDDATPLPLGCPLPNFEVFLLDEAGREVTAVDAEGELCVRAATVASGAYYRDEERSRERFVVDPLLPDTRMRVYRTGDLARRAADGELYFAGRRDDMIKSRGYRIELGEIQTALDRVEGLAESVVVAIPDPAVTHRLVAYVLVADGATLTAEAIARELTRTLPAYMVPERIELRGELPRTSTGKIDKKALVAEGA